MEITITRIHETSIIENDLAVPIVFHFTMILKSINQHVICYMCLLYEINIGYLITYAIIIYVDVVESLGISRRNCVE